MEAMNEKKADEVPPAERSSTPKEDQKKPQPKPSSKGVRAVR